MEFLKHVLPNGLEIVAECNGAAYSTAMGFFVKTGARDETADVAGVSHFLEHMAFKGTPSRSADDVNREFDEMGAHYNAYTNEENTVFYATVLPEQQDRAVDLLGDILRPSLREDDFQTEKKVILEEIRMYDDQPPFGADDKSRALYFGRHPLGQSVLGAAESIERLSSEAMRAYFEDRYSPTNIVLAASGRVDFDALVASTQRCCGRWPSRPTRRTVTPTTGHAGFQLICRPSASQQYTLMLATGPAAEDDDRYAAKLMATVLGDDSGSRLFWELVDPGLAEQVSLCHSEHEGAGLLMTYMSCEPDRAGDNLRCILDIYRKAEADGVSAAELEQAKNKVRSRIVLSGERPRGRLFAVGNDWVYRREYHAIESDLQAVADLTCDDLSAVLARCPLSRCATVTIGPLDELVL
ncbi:MAG: pitrilysin family protein [Thermoguttaceae bacterium]